MYFFAHQNHKIKLPLFRVHHEQIQEDKGTCVSPTAFRTYLQDFFTVGNTYAGVVALLAKLVQLMLEVMNILQAPPSVTSSTIMLIMQKYSLWQR